MNREIKFRYWNQLSEVMVNNPEMPYKKDWTIEQLFEPRGWVWMQATGLKDKNGVEIYEGDIVKTWHPFSLFDYNKDKQEEFCTGIWVCEWETPRFIFNPNDARCIGKMTSVVSERCEVIGNIYEHPDLLSTTKE